MASKYKIRGYVFIINKSLHNIKYFIILFYDILFVYYSI